MQDLAQFETDLWEAADNLRANSKLTSSDYFMPVLGVTRKEIVEADWSLTPGRYVGVAPAEVDADFDFEQAITEVHTELAALNKEAVGLANRIQENFEELGI